MTAERAAVALIVFTLLYLLGHVIAAVATGAFPGGAA